MSWLPPFSRGGAVRAASAAARSKSSPVRLPRMAESGLRRQRQRRHPVRVGVDQGLLAGVPLGQQLRRGRGAHQARVHDAGERHPGDVPRRGHAAAEVPDHLVGVGELLGEEAAAVASWRRRRCSPSPGPPAGRSPPAGSARRRGCRRSAGRRARRPRPRSARRARARPRAGALRMSSAESSLTMAPSNHSRQCTRKLSPGLTCTCAGMSGCQRLWPTICCSVNFFCESSGKTTSGMAPPWVHLGHIAARRSRTAGRGKSVGRATAGSGARELAGARVQPRCGRAWRGRDRGHDAGLEPGRRGAVEHGHPGRVGEAEHRRGDHPRRRWPRKRGTGPSRGRSRSADGRRRGRRSRSGTCRSPCAAAPGICGNNFLGNYSAAMIVSTVTAAG